MKIKTGINFIPIFITAIIFSACSTGISSVNYEFTSVRRGSIERTVTASGRINPVSTVRVLPQMSGKVEKVLVDFNDVVQRGDVLAELNTDVLRLRREQQAAAVIKARANYELQLINFNNQAALAERNLISEFELMTSRANLENLAADLRIAEQNLLEVETQINQFAFVTAPIDGIVLDRSINEGDTVSDSANVANSMFTLAENLSEMQIEATVGELDIASIHRGQFVRFTLESLPGRTYTGVVETIRLVPVVVSNVVSYTVFIRVENHDGSLLPGMTCAVEFIVERSENAILINNGALRFQPSNLSEEKIAEMVFLAGLTELTEEQREAAIETRNQAQEAAAQAAAQQAATARQAQGGGGGAAATGGIAGLLTGGVGRGGFVAMPFGQMPGQPQGQARPASTMTVRNLWYISDSGNLEVMQVLAGISSGSFTEIFPLETLEDIQFILRERI